MYKFLLYLLFGGAAISMFFIGAILHHRQMRHRLIARRPVLNGLSFPSMFCVVWSAVALLVSSVDMAVREGAGGPWGAAAIVLWAVVVALIWLIAQRCVSFRTQNFKFVFQWDSASEVSLHVTVRGSMLGHLCSRERRRAMLVRQVMQEFRAALELSRRLPARVATLTVASPWFGHGRHGALLEQLGQVLRTTFPDLEIKPVLIKKTRLDGMLLLITRTGREWHRVAKGRGIEVVGYRAARTVSA